MKTSRNPLGLELNIESDTPQSDTPEHDNLKVSFKIKIICGDTAKADQIKKIVDGFYELISKRFNLEIENENKITPHDVDTCSPDNNLMEIPLVVKNLNHIISCMG